MKALYPSRSLTLFACALSFGLLSPSLLAQSGKRKKKKPKKPRVEVLDVETEDLNEPVKPKKPLVTESGKRVYERAEDEIDSDSSEARREGKTVEINLDLIGFTPSPTSGLYLGYYLKPSQIINFRYGTAGGVFSSMDEKILSLSLKSMWGNSFYTNLGLSKRDYSFAWDMITVDEEGLFTGVYAATADASALGAEISIGNQWQWKYFNMGVDWIGFFLPLSSSGTDPLDTEGAVVDPNSLNNANSDLEYVKSSQAAFLRLYLGFHF